VHYLLASHDTDGPANSPLVPLSGHYDANDALLGLFASSLYGGGGDGCGVGGDAASLAYAVGTRFVEVALYRIPRHGYYWSGGKEEEEEEGCGGRDVGDGAAGGDDDERDGGDDGGEGGPPPPRRRSPSSPRWPRRDDRADR
jgi:hypothetical protein